VKGFDVSNYQKDLDFTSMKCEVCIIKATEGLTYVNPSLKDQYTKAKKLGMKVGFYHYLRANNPIDEAKHFLDTIKDLKSDCLYGIDSETRAEAKGISARTRTFADYLIMQGKSPMLYTDLNFYNTEILPCCKDLPLWIASWGSVRPSIKSVGWQYQGVGIDLDIFDNTVLLPTPKVVQAPKKVTFVNPNGKVFKVINARNVNVRSSMSLTENNIIDTLPINTILQIGRVYSNGWTNVYFGNHGGFVVTKYLK